MTVKSCEKKPVYRTLDSGAKTALLQAGWARVWCAYTLPSELFVFMTVTPKRVRPLGGRFWPTRQPIRLPRSSSDVQLGGRLAPVRYLLGVLFRASRRDKWAPHQMHSFGGFLHGAKHLIGEGIRSPDLGPSHLKWARFDDKIQSALFPANSPSPLPPTSYLPPTQITGRAELGVFRKTQ